MPSCHQPRTIAVVGPVSVGSYVQRYLKGRIIDEAAGEKVELIINDRIWLKSMARRLLSDGFVGSVRVSSTCPRNRTVRGMWVSHAHEDTAFDDWCRHGIKEYICLARYLESRDESLKDNPCVSFKDGITLSRDMSDMKPSSL